MLAPPVCNVGVAGDHHAVAAQNRDEFTGRHADRPIEILQVPRVDQTRDDSQEFAIGGIDASRDEHEPLIGEPAVRRLTDEGIGVIVGAEIAKIIAIRKIGLWNQPIPRPVQQLAVGVEHGDRVGLRQVPQPADKELMRIRPAICERN